GLVPHLDRPAAYLVETVALDQVRHRRAHQRRPLAVVARRRDVAAPPEHGLLSGGERGGHEAQLQEGRDAEAEVRVDHLVDVREGVPDVFRALILIGLIHPDAVAEQPVPADAPEPDLALNERERVMIVAAQRQLEPAGADAVAPGVGQSARRLLRDDDRVRHGAPSRYPRAGLLRDLMATA